MNVLMPKKNQVKLKQIWIADFGSNLLNQINHEHNVCATFHKCVFRGSRGRGPEEFSLAPLAYLQPPFFCTSVLNSYLIQFTNFACICVYSAAKLFGYFHFCTVSLQSIVSDVVSAIVSFYVRGTRKSCWPSLS